MILSALAALAWCQNIFFTHKLGANDLSKAKVTGKYKVGVRYITSPTRGNKLMVMYPADYKKELSDDNTANATWIEQENKEYDLNALCTLYRRQKIPLVPRGIV